MRTIAAGASFPYGTKHGPFTRAPGTGTSTDPNPLDRAIYSARLHALTGPVKINDDFYFFRVRKIVPGRYRPLSSVQAMIRLKGQTASQHRTLAAFVKAWRARWTAKTDCRAGYVVPKCRQYVPSPASPRENPYTLN